MENLRFTLKFGKTSIYRAATLDARHPTIREEDGEEETKETPLNRMFSERPKRDSLMKTE